MSTPPSTPKRRRLNRDTRRDILLLRKRGDTYAQIARFLGVTERAVQYTCNTKSATPKHQRAGRPAKLTSEEVDSLIKFVNSSKRTRRLSYKQLKDELYADREDIGEKAIKHALHKRGIFRRITLRKPRNSEKVNS